MDPLNSLEWKWSSTTLSGLLVLFQWSLLNSSLKPRGDTGYRKYSQDTHNSSTNVAGCLVFLNSSIKGYIAARLLKCGHLINLNNPVKSNHHRFCSKTASLKIHPTTALRRKTQSNTIFETWALMLQGGVKSKQALHPIQESPWSHQPKTWSPRK